MRKKLLPNDNDSDYDTIRPSLTPVEDSLIILTPPMSMCQYFAENDALQQKQCIATFCGKSL